MRPMSSLGMKAALQVMAVTESTIVSAAARATSLLSMFFIVEYLQNVIVLRAIFAWVILGTLSRLCKTHHDKTVEISDNVEEREYAADA